MGVGAGGAALPASGSEASSGLPAGGCGSRSSPGWALNGLAGSSWETMGKTVGSGWLLQAAANVKNIAARRIKTVVCPSHRSGQVNLVICNMAAVPFNGLAYRVGIPGWHTGLAYRVGIPGWHTGLAYRVGIPGWHTGLAYRVGIPGWHTGLAYRVGIPGWHTGLAYRVGIPGWHTGLAYRVGIPGWHTGLAYRVGIPGWHTGLAYRVVIPGSSYRDRFPLPNAGSVNRNQNGNRLRAGQTAGRNRHHFVPSRFALQVPELQSGMLPGDERLNKFTRFTQTSGNIHK